MTINNITMAGSRRIAPSFHIGPRAYNAAGFIPHPLGAMGINAATPMSTVSPVAQSINPGSALINQLGAQHPFTINGRAPG